MALDSPLDGIIKTTLLTDAEIKRITRDASQEAARMLRAGGLSDIRKAQVQLAKLQTEMWGAVGDATRVGVGDAFDASAMWQARYDVDLMRAAGLSGTHWQHSVIATARQGIDSFLGRSENKRSLSQNVYHNRALSTGAVDKTINNGLLLGKSVKEIATDVERYISPTVPGGASYSALRLARTEVVNAYHESSKAGYKRTPWVDKVKWNLSGSHARPDECNEYAEGGDARGAGVWKVDSVPALPHPNCLCYITPMTMPLDEYAKNFKAGKYDDYIDAQMGCVRVA